MNKITLKVNHFIASSASDSFEKTSMTSFSATIIYLNYPLNFICPFNQWVSARNHNSSLLTIHLNAMADPRLILDDGIIAYIKVD